MQKKITSLTAFIAIDPTDGTEGLMAYHSGRWGWIPMVAADDARLRRFQSWADDIAEEQGIEYKISRFVLQEGH